MIIIDTQRYSYTTTCYYNINGDKQAVETFSDNNKQHIAYDHDGDVVYLTRLQWDIDRVARDYPDIELTATKEMMV